MLGFIMFGGIIISGGIPPNPFIIPGNIGRPGIIPGFIIFGAIPGKIPGIPGIPDIPGSSNGKNGCYIPNGSGIGDVLNS